MPKMVEIGANPDWRQPPSSTVQEKAANAAQMKQIKAAGAIKVPYLTAVENMRTSGGMYRILPETQPVAVKVDTNLEEASMQELKVMMLNLGVKTDKRMSRTDVIRLIEKKLDEVEIFEDEAEE